MMAEMSRSLEKRERGRGKIKIVTGNGAKRERERELIWLANIWIVASMALIHGVACIGIHGSRSTERRTEKVERMKRGAATASRVYTPFRPLRPLDAYVWPRIRVLRCWDRVVAESWSWAIADKLLSIEIYRWSANIYICVCMCACGNMTTPLLHRQM